LDDYFFEGPYLPGTPQEALPTQEYEQWQYDQKFVTPLPSRKAIFMPIKGTTPVTAQPPLPSTAPTPVSERSLSLPGLTEDIAPELSPLSTQKVSKGKYRAPKEQEEEEVFDDAKEEPIPEPSFKFLKQPEYLVFESSVQQNCKNLELYCTVLHQNWNCSSSFVKIFHVVPVPVLVKCAIENCIKLVQTSTN
jgi:hypothetical protein